MSDLPPVSCMCLTYGRPTWIVNEAVESFLRQDYAGERELVLLNDCEQQTYACDRPGVVVVNTGRRFKTVGEKRNACAALARYDLLCVWDDDDLYLPHRLSFSVRMMQEHERFRRFFKPAQAFVLSHGRLSGPRANLHHSAGMWTREFFDEARGYAHMGSGQDMELELRFEALDKPHKQNHNHIDPADIYYLYRWHGTASFHLSGFGPDRDHGPDGNQKVADYVRRQMDAGSLPVGQIALDPHWQQDYVELTRAYVEALV